MSVWTRISNSGLRKITRLVGIILLPSQADSRPRAGLAKAFEQVSGVGKG